MKNPNAVAGGRARADALSPEQRSAIASLAARTRWQGRDMSDLKSGFKMTKSQAAKLGNLIRHKRDNPYLAILSQLRGMREDIKSRVERDTQELTGIDTVLASLVGITLQEMPVVAPVTVPALPRKNVMHRKGTRVCEYPNCPRKGRPYRFYKVDSHYCSKKCADNAYQARGRVALHRPSHVKGVRTSRTHDPITPEAQVPLNQRERFPLVNGKCQYPGCENIFQYRLGRGRPQIWCNEHKTKAKYLKNKKSLAERSQAARRQAKRGVTLYRDQDHIGTSGTPQQQS